MPGLPQRRRPRLSAARPPLLLPAHPEGRAHRGGRGVRDRHALRLPAQLRRRADLQRRRSKIVQVDIDPTEIGRNRPVDVGIVADSRSAPRRPSPTARTEATRTALHRRAAREPRRRSRALQDVDAQRRGRPSTTTGWRGSCPDVANAGDRDPMFIADGGNWVAMAAKVISLKHPGRWLDPGPLGCLGVGAPFALAAKLLHPERHGLGDPGRRLLRPQRLRLRDRAPLQAADGLRGGQRRRLGPDPPAPGGDVRRGEVARPRCWRPPATTRWWRRSAGYGELVTEPAQIRPALERALASGTVACVNVMLDPQAPAKSGAMGYAV